MTPAARLQAAIEILDQILDGSAVEQALTGWARRSRYAGSKDRAAVRDHVFSSVRQMNSHAALGGARTGRGLILGALRAGGVDPEPLFTGERHAPAALSEGEFERAVPDFPIVDLPEWLWGAFQTSLGADKAHDAELALRDRAPVFLRVNSTKASVSHAQEILAEGGIETVPHPSASTALIVERGERAIRNSRPYLDGLVELQDGASQAIVERMNLQNGMRVLDYCAGGGGKTLAMAAAARLELVAHDAAEQRLRDLPERAKRAGAKVKIAKTHDLKSMGRFDLVLCDAPCSGSGSWRRAPEGKWRLTPDRFAELQDIQASILAAAAQLVKPGGVLGYATCSLLVPENSAQVDRFLDHHPGWSVHDTHQWFLDEGTDGFFLAQLQAPAA
ncbi:RsmB/NOP family class I SAM-dependent RNA methyltransferase [Rhodobacteraceae bacterium M382]|nr:RsmB/NOP family class I SAM-dependent RNA methyltransferase [Rhodobacteraceae bacterium M382]